MIGKIIYKTELESKEFAEILAWCVSTHRGYLEDRGDYYEVMETLPDSPYPPPTLIERQAWKLAELKSIRDAKEVADIQVNGRLFDYDEKARERINAAIIALDLTGGTITWTLADNTDKEVSANDLRYVIAMVAQRSNVLHTQYRHLKEAVNAATTVSEVESISWPEE